MDTVMTQAEKEEFSDEILKLIRDEPDQGRRTVLMMIFKQNVEFGEITALIRGHIEESSERVAVLDLLGSPEDVEKRSAYLDRMIEKEEKRIRNYDLVFGKYGKWLASQIGRHTPKYLLAFLALLGVFGDKVQVAVVKGLMLFK